MLKATVLALTFLSQDLKESVFNTYAVHLQNAAMPGGCASTNLGQFRDRTYRFRNQEPVTLIDGRFLERNSIGSIEWETRLERAELIQLGSSSAVLLQLVVDHVGGTGSTTHVLVVQCGNLDSQVFFEASGPIPIRGVSYSKSGGLILSHGVWSRDDSHASPSREVIEHYTWVPQRRRFVLIEARERRLAP